MTYKAIFFLLLLVTLVQSCAVATGDEKIITGAERTDVYLPLIENAVVGVVANHTSLVGKSHLVDTLLSHNINLVKIFSPEHGFRGSADAGEHVDNEIDSRTGLPIVSLYGSRRKPFLTDMEGLDIIVFDIQDVGARFYTYISTLQYVMERAAEAGIQLIILDRPNPNGSYVDGPILDPEFRSFVGMQPIPVVHGMTIAEYARMINSEGWMEEGRSCDLVVVECLNYNHDMEYILPVPPSPNLPNQNSIYLYPSLCFFEGTVFSCGRGTGSPFQVFGHPDYPDNEFSFIPEPGIGAAHPKLEGQLCFGLDLSDATEAGLIQGERINLDWLLDAYNIFPDKDNFFNSYFNTLAGNTELKQQIQDGLSHEEIRLSWQEELDKFKQIRSSYLLYD